jgi:uncharacterized protein
LLAQLKYLKFNFLGDQMKKYLLMLALLVSFSAEAEYNTANGVQGTAMDCLKSARKMLVIGGCLTGQEAESALKEEQNLYTALGCPAYEPSQQYAIQSLGVLAKAKQDYQADKAKVCSEIGVSVNDTPVENTEPKPIDESKNTDEAYLDGKDLLNAANDKLNAVWQSTTPKVRAMMLPEQREWLKDREKICSETNPGDDDKKFSCMATLTDQRTEYFEKAFNSVRLEDQQSADSVTVAFYCIKPESKAETFVCGNDDLITLNNDLNVIFSKVRSESAGVDGETGEVIDRVGDDQKRWATDVRDKCQDIECFKSVYSARIAELNEMINR